MEKRTFERIIFKTRGIIICNDDKKIDGEIKDLSLKGAFLITEQVIQSGKEVTIKISLIGDNSDLTITANASVIRSDNEGIALHFIDMSLDSFILLKNIITYNSDNPEQVMEDFKEYIKKNTNKL